MAFHSWKVFRFEDSIKTCVIMVTILTLHSKTMQMQYVSHIYYGPTVSTEILNFTSVEWCYETENFRKSPGGHLYLKPDKQTNKQKTKTKPK